jgi:hypothetical protein
VDPETYTVSPLDAATLLPIIEREGERCAVHPVYTEETLDWVLQHLEGAKRHRELRGAVIRGRKGKPVGSYLFYHEPNGVSQVRQMIAEPGHEYTVVAALFKEAYELGAVSLWGRTQGRMMPALVNQRCTFTVGYPWSMILTRDEELRRALQRQDAFISNLELGWWS